MNFSMLIIGLIGSSTIAMLGYGLKAISFSGIFATFFIGTIIAISGDFSTWSVIIFLFGSSLFINLFKKGFFPHSIEKEAEIHEKKGPRDASQILANTLPATISLSLFSYTQQPAFIIAYLSSLAGATSDTWGSEIGILAKGNTFDLSTLKKIPPGISGGISLSGTICSLLGSLFSTLTFLFFNLYFPFNLTFKQIITIILIGFFASIFDSLLGSIFQGTYLDKKMQLTDQQENNQLINGFSWITNDMVNFITNMSSAFIAYLIFR